MGPIRGRRRQAAYCSVACRTQAFLAKRKERRSSGAERPPYYLECCMCDAAFEARTRDAHTCSTRCRVAWWRFWRGKGRLPSSRRKRARGADTGPRVQFD
jgi:hypothetical protein